MSTNATQTNESSGLDDRTVRALTQYLTVLPEAPGIYKVVSESGETYTVDTHEERCTCPDHQYREVRCKHLRRVAFATGTEPIPAVDNPSKIDPQLGEHTDSTPEVAVTDSGIIEADDDAEVLDESDARPDNCECMDFNGDHELPCWPCYREGFETNAKN